MPNRIHIPYGSISALNEDMINILAIQFVIDRVFDVYLLRILYSTDAAISICAQINTMVRILGYEASSQTFIVVNFTESLACLSKLHVPCDGKSRSPISGRDATPCKKTETHVLTPMISCRIFCMHFNG